MARMGYLVAIALLWPAGAQAYPQWQLSAGAVRCSQCHLAPAGGGLLSHDGRRISGGELSTFAGDGALLHGAATLPGWLALGADLRGAYLTENPRDAGGAARATFPMEGDAMARLAAGSFSLYGTLGVRGQMPGDSSLVPSQNFQPIAAPWLVSREHWLMWRPGDQGPYLRAGRFFAPFGLGLAGPMARVYVRRDLGFDQLEESYNLSGGFLSNRWELHATVFAPDFLRHLGGEETGATAYLEGRTRGGAGALAIQGKYAVRSGVTRTIGGVVGKVRVTAIRTLFLAEADAVILSFDSTSRLPCRGQAIGLVGVAVLPFRGLMITALAEHYQEDVQVRGAARRAASLLLGWFPYAHIEADVMARADLAAGTDARSLLFAQLRYFL